MVLIGTCCRLVRLSRIWSNFGPGTTTSTIVVLCSPHLALVTPCLEGTLLFFHFSFVVFLPLFIHALLFLCFPTSVFLVLLRLRFRRPL